jgi:hypothetical protein
MIWGQMADALAPAVAAAGNLFIAITGIINSTFE